MTIGSACAPDDGKDGEVMEVRGRDLSTGIPKEITLTEKQIAESLVDPVKQIVEAIKVALESTPPELSADIISKGIYLTGGSANINNISKLITKETGLKVNVATEPSETVINGISKILASPELMKLTSVPREKEYE